MQYTNHFTIHRITNTLTQGWANRNVHPSDLARLSRLNALDTERRTSNKFSISTESAGLDHRPVYDSQR